MKPKPKPKADPSDVPWMTSAGLEDCKRHAGSASLVDLAAALKWCKDRPKNATRGKIIAGAMKRRYGVMAAADMKGAAK